MKSFDLHSDPRFLRNQETIDGNFSLQALLNGVVQEVISKLEVIGCRVKIYKEEDGECEATANAGSFLDIHEAKRGCSPLHQSEIAGNQSAEAVSSIPIPISWKGCTLGTLRVYPFHEKPVTPDEVRWLHAVAQSLATSIQSIQRYVATLEKGETLTNDVWRWFKAPKAGDVITAGHRLSPPFMSHRPMYL